MFLGSMEHHAWYYKEVRFLTCGTGPDTSLIQHKAQAYNTQVLSPGQGHAQSDASTQQQAITCMKGGVCEPPATMKGTMELHGAPAPIPCSAQSRSRHTSRLASTKLHAPLKKMQMLCNDQRVQHLPSTSHACSHHA